MASFLNKLRASGDTVTLKPKVRRLLQQDLARLNDIEAGLGTEALNYILKNQPSDILLRLQGHADEATTKLNLSTSAWGNDNHLRSRFLQNCKVTAPHFYLRLAQVYTACSQQNSQATQPHWLLVWLNNSLESYWGNDTDMLHPSAQLLEQILQADNQAKDTLATLILTTSDDPLWQASQHKLVRLHGMAAYLAEHSATAKTLLQDANAKQANRVIEQWQHFQLTCADLVPQLTQLATGNAKTVRQLASALLASEKDLAKPQLLEQLQAGGTNSRIHTVNLLAAWFGADVHSALIAQQQKESSAKVKQAIAELLETPSPAPVEDALHIPPVTTLPPAPPLDHKQLSAHLQDVAERVHQTENGRWQQATDAATRYQLAKPEKLSQTNINTLLQLIDSPQRIPKRSGDPLIKLDWDSRKTVEAAIKQYIISHHAEPTRLLLHTALATLNNYQHQQLPDCSFLLWNIELQQCIQNAGGDLRSMANALTDIQLHADSLAQHWLNAYDKPTTAFDDDGIWPYFVERQNILEQALGLSSGDFKNEAYRGDSSLRAMEILADMPSLPAVYQNRLYELALAGTKAQRLLAQTCLSKVTGQQQRAISALDNGKQDIRAAAAYWLGNMSLDNNARAAAVAAIAKRLPKEKSELAKAAQLSTLEKLGEDVATYLDRAQLLVEAEKGLNKGLPKQLDWLRVDSLPTLHWQDDGKPLAAAICQWWIVQAFKLKTPEPNALLRKYLQYVRTEDAQAFGHFVLSAWIAQDTVCMTEEQAVTRAKQDWQQHRSWYQDQFESEQHYIAHIKGYYLSQPIGSASKEKGLLAIAAAVPDSRTAAAVEHYLKTWYGYRAAQCKSLLLMLAHMEDPAAIQVVLAVARRFRTKGIRDEAQRLVQDIADRKGWSLDELGDRTIPSAGLDEQGLLALDYGITKLNVQLGDDLKFIIQRPTGKPLKSLPKPRQDDDEELAKEAKKQFNAAKRELKAVLAQQQVRLYEAMCTQRQWRFADLQQYLLTHPIVGRYCQRVVWAELAEDTTDTEVSRTFRLLEDGSLSDADDNEVTIAPTARIELAHGSKLSAEASQQWQQHLSDYEVTPLFEQFPSQHYQLSPDQAQQTSVSEYKGYMIETFALRGAATKANYSRGNAEDGGWFYCYQKEFPSLKLRAEIEFTGNGLPEENRPVALLNLKFLRSTENSSSWGSDQGLPLADIPPVLLSECVNDLAQIAAKGSGFDEQWEGESQY